MNENERPRCNTHGLVLGPSGECVLCRRTSAPPAPSSRARFAGAVFVFASAMVGVVVGVRTVVRMAHASPPALAAKSAPMPVAIVEPPSPSEPPPLWPEPSDPPAHPPRPRAPWATIPRPERAEEIVAPPLPELPPEPAEPDPIALQAARRAVSITVYSAAWCPSCRAAIAYMREHEIEFVDRDIDQDERNHRALDQLNPRHTIPTFEIDGDILVGFGAERLEAALDRAASARLEHR